MTLTIPQIEEIARTCVGDHTGWQARFADAAGISRAHLSNVLKGTRPVPDDFKAGGWAACILQAELMRRRADRLDAVGKELQGQVVASRAKARSITKEQYDRESDEAEEMLRSAIGGGTD